MNFIHKPFNFEHMFPTEILNEFWDSFNTESFSRKISQGFPKCDQYLENGNNIMEVALAGYSKDQLSVEVESNCLTISAKKEEPKLCGKVWNVVKISEQSGSVNQGYCQKLNGHEGECGPVANTNRRSIARRSFSKSFTDSTNTWNLEAAEVSFVDGLLKVVIPPMKQSLGGKKVLEIK